MKSINFEVHGKVQGVFFRKHTQRTGETLGLRGWCQNTDHGTVIGVVEGPDDRVEDMKKWLSRVGSPKSRIEGASFTQEKPITGFTYDRFEIKK